jgi:hypothetical protein
MEGKMATERIKKIWIALGSIAGLMASVGGVVTVFFPDLFNLQKQKIAEFDIEIVGRGDVDKLDAFLDKHTGKLVNLSVSVCRARGEAELPKVQLLDDSLRVDHDDCEPDSSCTTTTYYFAELDAPTPRTSGVWGQDKFAACRNDEHAGLYVTGGYFIVPSQPGFGQGHLEWLLTPVSATDIALKQY